MARFKKGKITAVIPLKIKSKIIKPHGKLNELEPNYKVVVWKNGIVQSVRFAPTKKQALEIQRRERK